MTSSVELIQFKNTLKTNSIVLKVKAIIREKLQEVELNKVNKTDPELILTISRWVWAALKELKLTLEENDKKDIVVEIFSVLFTLTSQELDVLKSQIQFFISNNQIKGVSNKKWVLSVLGAILKKVL